jgi:hypothetical protein
MGDMMEEKRKVVIKRHEPGSNGGGPNTGAWILIGIGIFLLLANLGIIAGLSRLWPLILIVLGLWILSGRGTRVETKHERFTAPVENAKSARVKLNLSVGDTTVTPLADTEQLIDADINYLGEVHFATQGDSEKFVSLGQTENSWSAFMNPVNWTWFGRRPDTDLSWRIGLNPSIPTDLDINGGVGRCRIDLSAMNLTALDVSGGVGEINVTLPAKNDHLDGRIQVGVGKLDINIPQGLTANLRVKGGVGETIISTASDAAVRIMAKTGIGDVDMASRFQRISGGEDDFIGKSGVWETPGFNESAQQIIIDFDGGIGQLRVR